MGKIIASTYELLDRLGSGSGGVVYLGRHLRLDKLVAIKAGKHGPSAGAGDLRQEVDALKDLSNAYIPRVYDYIEEGGEFYTVIDYIEGESLDKPLERGERFSQPQVIRWARQLLDALCYLHSRPPHGILHADIKPANVMLTPAGDIRLIDFNIALALGVEGSVQVGYSYGYASPEHYAASRQPVTGATVLLGPGGEPLQPHHGGGRRILDARSDVYSLGATLYHLLTGARPPKDAENVRPISSEGVSPLVAGIIQKAMSPLPEQRYQTAREMLGAFQRLYEDDPRQRRHKKRVKAAAAVFTVLFLLGGGSAITGSQLISREHALLEQRANQENRALELMQKAEEACAKGDMDTAKTLSLEALELSGTCAPRVQNVLSDCLGVYKLTEAFQAAGTLQTGSEVLKLELSPDGTMAAVVNLGKVTLFDIATAAKLFEAPLEPSALADAAFTSGGLLVYAGKDGISAYDPAGKRALWTGKPATAIAVSGDGQTVAGVYKNDGSATVYRARTGETLCTVDFKGRSQPVLENNTFADAQDSILALNEDGSLLAASFSGGGLCLFDTESGQPAPVLESSPYESFQGGFCGDRLIFTGYLPPGPEQEGEAFLSTIDAAGWREGDELSAHLAGESPFLLEIMGDSCYIYADGAFLRMDPDGGGLTELQYSFLGISSFCAGEDLLAAATEAGEVVIIDQDTAGTFWYGNALPPDIIKAGGDYILLCSYSSQYVQALQRVRYDDPPVLRYSPDFPHVELRVDQNAGTAMLFQYDRFAIFDSGGGLIAETELPDPNEVYDQQYRHGPEGDFLEVTYRDGLIQNYSASDGRLLSGSRVDPPTENGDEVFETNSWRISAPVHGTPQVFDKATGELLGELEPDDYLVYATQMDDGTVMTEYATAEGQRYALLLDAQMNKLARLPGLCDLAPDGTLWFDDNMGNVRRGHVYSLQELISLAKKA